METTKCTNCGGAGHISAFRHISGGVCFHCEGSGLEETATVKALAAGRKPTALKSFTYVTPTGEFKSFVVYADGTTNHGSLDDARKACKDAIAAGAELIESVDLTR